MRKSELSNATTALYHDYYSRQIRDAAIAGANSDELIKMKEKGDEVIFMAGDIESERRCDGVEKAIAVFNIVVVVVFIALASLVWYNSTHFEQKEYSLSEIEPGVYCVYNTVSSAIPAENCEMVTLCCNGHIMTLKGSVDIVYSTDEPYAIIKDCKIANGDEITVFVPNNTVKFQENFSVS